MKVRAWGALFKEAAIRWVDDEAYRLGAAFSYYALFSIFPLVLLGVSVFGFFLGDDGAVRERVLGALDTSQAPEVRALLRQTLASMQEHQTARGVGAVVGLLLLLVGASGVFGELDTALNRIWRVKPRMTHGFKDVLLGALRDKALSFALVAGGGVFLLATFVVTAVVHGLTASVAPLIPFAFLWRLVNLAVSLAMTTLLFACTFRVVPQTRVAWGDVVLGALVTALLFAALDRVFAMYLTHLTSFAAYGAVGGVLALVTWIYLSSQILFFGAELTRVYAEKFGSLAPRRTVTPPAAVGMMPRSGPGVAGGE